MIIMKIQSLTLFVAFFLLTVQNITADSLTQETKANKLLAGLENKNKHIKDFTVNFTATVYYLSFSFPLRGKFFFKYPNKMKMKFDNLPYPLNEYKSLFENLAPGRTVYGESKKRYIRMEKANGKILHLIEITPLKQNNIKAIYLWLNDATLYPDFAIVKYNDSSSIETENDYAKDAKFSLPYIQKAKLKSKFFTAKAHVKYYNYNINTGIQDDIFK